MFMTGDLNAKVECDITLLGKVMKKHYHRDCNDKGAWDLGVGLLEACNKRDARKEVA